MRHNLSALLKSFLVVGLLTLPGISCKPQGDAGADANQTEDGSNDSPAKLTIGSKAPPLDIQYWVQDGNGKFPKIGDFEAGKVYVVEFWATWCGPCVQSMPHLAEIQQKYADRDVQLISISDEELETVEAFLQRDVQGADKDDPIAAKTYQELTSVYCLTTDPDRSNHAAYMEAAGENGIPTSFIVGKDGIIEWIGHPMSMDEPLERIVSGDWNREDYIAAREEEKELQREMMTMQPKMREISIMFSKGEYDQALENIDELLQQSKDSPKLQMMLAMTKLAITLEGKPEQANQVLEETLELAGDDTEAINNITWSFYQTLADAEQVDAEQLATAVAAAEKMVELTPTDGGCIDTLAHLVYLQGDLDRAIELQTRAVENAGALKGELTEFLDQLKEEKEASTESPAGE